MCRRTSHIAVLLGRDEIINFKLGQILPNASYTNGTFPLKQGKIGQILKQECEYKHRPRGSGVCLYTLVLLPIYKHM